jgi:hypothetical protein
MIVQLGPASEIEIVTLDLAIHHIGFGPMHPDTVGRTMWAGISNSFIVFIKYHLLGLVARLSFSCAGRATLLYVSLKQVAQIPTFISSNDMSCLKGEIASVLAVILQVNGGGKPMPLKRRSCTDSGRIVFTIKRPWMGTAVAG